MISVEGIRQAIEDDVIAKIRSDHERRFAVVSIPEPRTPYLKTVEKLMPNELTIACAAACGMSPPPLLATFREIGGKDPQLVREQLPLV